MPEYDFKCEFHSCGREFSRVMGMRESICQSRDGFPHVECPWCGANKPKRLIRPKNLLLDVFTGHGGTFDHHDNRHPPEMDGLTFGNRKEWEDVRAAYNIQSKGEIDPLPSSTTATFRPGEDLAAAQREVLPEAIKILRYHGVPMDFVTLSDAISTAPREVVHKCLLKAAAAGILVKPQPGMYAIPNA